MPLSNSQVIALLVYLKSEGFLVEKNEFIHCKIRSKTYHCNLKFNMQLFFGVSEESKGEAQRIAATRLLNYINNNFNIIEQLLLSRNDK